jgi:hypothetical protein
MRMERLARVGLGAVVFLVLTVSVSQAAIIDLSTVFSNSGYETGTAHVNWSVTQPNATYTSAVPVNPVIQPLNPAFNNGTLLPALTAPAGNNFVGETNPTLNGDNKGKLAHDVLAGSWAPGADTFQLELWGNRGRLNSNSNLVSTMPGGTGDPVLHVTLLGFSSVAAPTVDGSDNWNQTVRLNVGADFTNWGSPGSWTQQLFSFTNTSAFTLTYIAVAVAGMNNNHDQYVAWDISAVPEPMAILAAANFGMLGLCLRRRR